MASTSKPRSATGEAQLAIQARMPREFVNWLLDQAAEEQVSMSQILRDCVAGAIVSAGDAKRYGIDVEDLDFDTSGAGRWVTRKDRKS